MGFVIGVVVALIVIFLLAYITIKKPVFGEIVIAIAVLMVLAAVFFYFQKDDRVEKTKQLIPLSEIELTDITHQLAYGNYHKLTARVKNLSQKYRLQAIILNLSFFQCPKVMLEQKDNNFSDCRLLTQKEHKVNTRLAAGQSSEIESYILLDDDVLLQAKKSLQWKIELLSGVAR